MRCSSLFDLRPRFLTHLLRGFLLLASGLAHAAAEPVSPVSMISLHPPSEGLPAHAHFTVRVRVPGGEWRELFCHAVEVDMHRPRLAAMAAFDFSGEVEIEVASRRGAITTARIRPLSHGITPEIAGDTLRFRLTRPRHLSIELDGDMFENLHLFAGAPPPPPPPPDTPGLIHFGPGLHQPGPRLKIPSGATVYFAPGAVLQGTTLVVDQAEDVRIIGRGILLRGQRGIEITHSSRVEIDGLTVINPRYYTVHGGESRHLVIRNLKSFSSESWSDGIDLMSCSDVLVEGVFLRNSDDCIAIYGHRWDFRGDARDITVRDSTLWADVAHPINIGTHGNPAAPELIENLLFQNLDILNHDEPQLGYQGCLAITASDENLVRDIRFEHIRIEDFERGQLLNLRVTFNRTYATAPGRGIENVLFKNITYTGSNAEISLIGGYDSTRAVRDIVFEDLRINGVLITDTMPDKPRWFSAADMARIHVGDHVEGLVFRSSETPPPPAAPTP